MSMTLYHLEPNLKAPVSCASSNVAEGLALISAMDKLHRLA